MTPPGDQEAHPHHRLAFIGAPGHRLGGGGALEQTHRRVEAHTGGRAHCEAALQLLASPYGLRDFHLVERQL